MTQHERQMIANMASAAWEELNEAEYESEVSRFRFGYGFVKAVLSNWKREDELVSRLMTEWATLHRVAEAFGIEYETTERAAEFQKKTRCWLEGVNDGGDFE